MEKFKLLILVTLILLIATGCGASKSISDPTTTTTLDRLKSDGELSYAMSGQYQPFNYFNEQNELIGFDVKIGQEIVKRINLNTTPIVTEWDGLIAGLTTSKFNMILGSMAITDERLEKANFSIPYYRSGAPVIAPW